MSPDISIRPYERRDRDACLEILRTNTPEFFLPSDLGDFAGFLDRGPGPYFVLEEGGAVVACGGWFQEDGETAGLSWGMVVRSRQGKGLGKRLLHFRLAAIASATGASRVILQTIPEVEGFFRGAGFEVTAVEPGAYGGVFDRVRMERALTRDAGRASDSAER